MELALGALGSLAPKLAGLLQDEYVKHKGLKPDIEALSRELLAMHAALKDVSQVPWEKLPEVDKLWARKVRELAYDTEDAIDTYAVRVARREPAADDLNIFKKICRKAAGVVKNAKGRHQLADKVKDIKNLSKELADLAKYRISATSANPTASTGMDPRLLNMYKSEAELVGIEAPRDELIRRLTDAGPEQSLKIVSIVGFGGLGKTALAKTVHDRLKNQFDCSAFVSVGRNPRIMSVLEKLLEKLEENKYGNIKSTGWDVERLYDELHRFLHNKRFFIVIDDIWDTKSWKRILYSLKDNNCGSRIIMTTRNSDVVTKDVDVYKLKPLSHDNSKILFNKRILTGDGECLVNQSDELVNSILSKCDGVPLAIIAIASLLVDKPWQKWSEVYESIVSRHGDSTMEILSYSFEDIPSHLKPCLMYMSMFPEDYEVWKYELIWMWIGEGFVQIKKEGDSILEQGERYFNELLNRSMIQPIENDIDCSIFACKVHDIVYDLISNLSREENFITVFAREQYASSKSVRRKVEMDFSSTNTKVRRLSLQTCHFEHIQHDTLGMSDAMRSLCIKNSAIDSTPQLYCFQICRLLFIEDSSIPNLKHLGKLLHLRYLEINRTHIDKLPEEIVDLKALQTLLLTDIGPHELPSTVCALTTLMCMRIKGFKKLPSNNMGNLVYLEELCLDPVAGGSETDDLVVQLAKLTRLRVLHVKFAGEMEESLQNALVNSIRCLEKIQDLKLNFPKDMKASAAWQQWVPPRQLWRLLIPGIRFPCLPSWICPSHLPRISNLAVRALVVQEQDMENLARLPELCYLRLICLSTHQGYTVDATGGFKKLRVCRLGTAFKFLQGAMPSLEVLDLYVDVAGYLCTVDGVEHDISSTKDAIGDLDLGLGNLLSLERVEIDVDCQGARRSDVEDAEAALRCAVKDHPKHPALFIRRIDEGLMLSDDEHL
ncbi:hypothetical protein U9M48_034676 [Paspalum notatum var. saurae]|uniref:Uncharacterized protein n=1 Tax=Paspalum notatum var. saurae TaxID=547442 RepID=A0AAQ3UA83_PASNO